MTICINCGEPTEDIGGLCPACTSMRESDPMAGRLELLDDIVSKAVEVLHSIPDPGSARGDIEYVRDRLIMGNLTFSDQIALGKILNSALTKTGLAR